MNFPLDAYRSIIERFHRELIATDGTVTAVKLREDAWALIEIVGHLIDSAANNHQRFVRLQLGSLETLPGYEAEVWTGLQSYLTGNWTDTVGLWHLYNRHLLHVIERMDGTKLENYWLNGGQRLTLAFLVNDYFRHLEGHIEHFTKRKAEVLQAAG